MRAYIVDLGASNIDPENGAATAQCVPASGAPYNETPVFQCLGVTSLPYQADTDGDGEVTDGAQGIMLTGIAGADGVLIGARDTRHDNPAGAMAPGETCVHSTGKGFESRLLCKDQLVCLIVGDDTVLVLDRKERKFQVAIDGMIIEASRENGISMAEPGGAALILRDGNATLKGKAVFLGENPITPIAGIPPTTGTPAPSTSVLVPAPTP